MKTYEITMHESIDERLKKVKPSGIPMERFIVLIIKSIIHTIEKNKINPYIKKR